MLLVSMGTQPIQCERIINSILDANIKDEIIIQAYYKNESNRIIPKNVLIKEFIPYDEMENYINKANVVVVSGTGGIFRALQKGKKVIIYPRLGKYKEAVNDHGLDMKVLEDSGYASFVENSEDFKKIYETCLTKKYKKFVSNNKLFLHNLEEEIKKL